MRSGMDIDLAVGMQDDPWGSYVERYHRGEWRARIFRDMVLAEIGLLGRPATVLDVGCGRGFDDDLRLQEQIAAAATRYIGIEPDPTVPAGSYVHEVHRCTLEDAPVEPGSIDVALAVMVLEHVPDPGPFWNKLHEVLRDGGVFWGFTTDARHIFCVLSRWTARLRVKDLYLDLLHGRRGAERYENYPVHYRCNTPEHVIQDTRAFQDCAFINFSRVGQLDYYLPRPLRPLGRWADRRATRRRGPGTLLAIRLVK